MSHPARPNFEALAGHGVLHVLGDEDAEQDLGDFLLVDFDAVDQEHGLLFVHDETLREALRLEFGEEF